MKIGVVANQTKPGAAAVVVELHARAAEHGLAFFYDAETARLLNGKLGKARTKVKAKPVKGFPLPALARKVDLLLVIGGDGSLLRVVHEIYPSPVPLLGINLGRLGFLTALRRDELDTVFSALLEQRLRISPRLPLHVRIRSGKTRREIPCALNEIVLSRGGSRMALIRVEADGAFVNEYIADGLILATATGSTAYSLAAGGPILTPEAEGIFVNPICPHTLSNRGLLLSGKAAVKVTVPNQNQHLTLHYDGTAGGAIRSGDVVELRTAENPVNFAFLRERDFFHILREKLRWSGAALSAV
ncbi:NAD+ kinase [Verrucomicrobium sp. GAS474]|uniref:NAD(+)/NADH kinase n=1 Tax=Verrucomicrobium sp. GAS474 TaxID=1882831 RepID=UPI00087B26C6|nr:NAD(+)/NADH kinase [Verrucomicrobium sp. GAS474]SDU04497.1 NAD+ kinase [Verrucomicrobium sp. GAS474]